MPLTGRTGAAIQGAQSILSAHQIAYFRTFGFLLLPGLFVDDVDRLTDGFEEVFAREPAKALDPDNQYHRTSDPQYEGEARWIVPAFIDKSEKLRWLRDDRRIDAVARGLLGDEYVYAESDGNLFNCDVYWHFDAFGADAAYDHIKLYFYLDSLKRDAGALRVIPGSHWDSPYTKALRRQLTRDPAQVGESLGVAIDEIPSHVLEVEPGDCIVGDFRTVHASFGGAVRRRLFTVNFGARRNAA